MEREREQSKQASSSQQFKTKDGSHWTGLIDDPNLEIIERFDDHPLRFLPKKNYNFMKAMPNLGATVDSMTVPNVNNYKTSCGDTTNQSIGSCYMHAITNQAKWLVWMHTGVKYSPSNNTIDQTYAKGIDGGMYSAISRLWDADDDFIRAFKNVASKCGITKSNAASGKKYSGVGAAGKENAIKMLNLYGPLWFAHDCGMYASSGYHAIIFIGYDEQNAYFQNSWGAPAGNPKVTWDRFTSYNHSYNTFFQTYGNVDGVNVWKDL